MLLSRFLNILILRLVCRTSHKRTYHLLTLLLIFTFCAIFSYLKFSSQQAQPFLLSFFGGQISRKSRNLIPAKLNTFNVWKTFVWLLLVINQGVHYHLITPKNSRSSCNNFSPPQNFTNLPSQVPKCTANASF